jgi:hypothetical protein
MAGLAGFEVGAEAVRCAGAVAASAVAWLSTGDDDVGGCFDGTAVVADVLMR